MLQRAASNAYSWWWASHIRTKQSKWLEQNLEDMGEKVQIVLKLIQEDGDSFAKRAEMYYKKRPELIQFVEESYRAYRALAERYEHMSNELQNANRTLATVCPEQVQFPMHEEDEDAKSRLLEKHSSTFTPKEIPKAPNDLIKDQKVIFSPASKILQTKKATNSSSTNEALKSGLSKRQALEEINELQKEILSLQTEKEFVKSSYENGLVRYWEIGEQIMEKHDRICKLQDEFGAGQIIEDHEARSIMAAAALKSCRETLAQLQKNQGKTTEDAKTESKRIKDFWEKLSSLKNEFPHSQSNKEKRTIQDGNVKARDNLRNTDEEGSIAKQARKDLELLKEKVREHFETGSDTSLSVTEMADKVDELVDKVINLDSAVSSHAALVKRLRAENDDLQMHIRNLDDEKESLISNAGAMSKKLRHMEEIQERYDGIQELNKNVKNQNISLQRNFTEAQCSIDHLSEKLPDVKPDEELEITSISQRKETLCAGKKIKQEEKHNLDSQCNKLHSMKAKKGQKQQDKTVITDSTCQDLQYVSQNKKLKQVNSSAKEEGSFVEVIYKENSAKHEISDHKISSGKEKDVLDAYSTHHGKQDTRSASKDDHEDLSRCEEQKVQDTTDVILDKEAKKEVTLREDEPNMEYLYTSGLENKEKLLLNEHTAVLHNYKDVNENQYEIEKKKQDNFIDKQVRELRSANAMKDEEIRLLRQKLTLMQRLLDGNKDAKEQKDPADQQQSNSLNVSLYTLLSSTPASLPFEEEESKDIKLTPVHQPQSTSPVEEKFRVSIDELLEQNLDFWLRFSISFSQIQKFDSEVRDLLADLSKIEEKVKKQEGISSPRYNLKSDARPLYKHLREIHTELAVWLEKGVLLKDELKSRFSSICDIQEEITKALKESAEDDKFTFNSHQAAKFQGEILNMKQENNKVADELQAGLDHVTALQLEVEQTLTNLNEEFKISESNKDSNPRFINSESRSRIPLRSFIFGVKPKMQRPSLFSCMTPVRNKKYNFRQGNSGPL